MNISLDTAAIITAIIAAAVAIVQLSKTLYGDTVVKSRMERAD